MGAVEVRFYTRAQCPLCQKAKKILDELRLVHSVYYEEIDIHSSDELVEKYGLMIPVIERDGDVIGYGQINKNQLLQNLIK
ncbi:glutaredoxin family protein [Bacillus massiliglaciei]|uniref:glutaredoxin family protein n=1 Tax=Bacillus massiliglaciei TaxID=1816693 RepID=UPI002D21B3B0|nr:glutaredoxin family protein [Bacillus massiliglaciei]